MKRVIQFTRGRYVALIISLFALVAGGIGIYLQGGFDLSVDLQGGVSQQVQIAPVAAVIDWPGATRLQVGVSSGDPITGAAGGLLVDATVSGERVERRFGFDEFPTVGALTEALVTTLPGAGVVVFANDATAAERLLAPGIDAPPAGPVSVHALPAEGDVYATIDRMRSALTAVESFSLQGVGAANRQEFLVRVEVPSDADEDRIAAEARLAELLSEEFSADEVIVRMTDYVGPSFSRFLGGQAVSLIAVAAILILLYVAFRFELGFAVGAIVAIIHDVGIMLGVLGVFRFEVSTATIAAVLTIVGYSLNDTIVILDRVRENRTVMRDASFEWIINTSINQSLSRTIITSLTTLLAVVAIYVFGTAAIQTFAMALIVGVVVGTYSSMFVAAPIILWWHRVVTGRGRRTVGTSAPEPGRTTPDQTADPDDEGQAAQPEKAAVAASSSSRSGGPQQVVRVQRTKKSRRKRKS